MLFYIEGVFIFASAILISIYLSKPYDQRTAKRPIYVVIMTILATWAVLAVCHVGYILKGF